MRISYHTPWPRPLPENVKVAYDLDSTLIGQEELEKLIWETHWQMHVICSIDLDPCLPEQDEVIGRFEYRLTDEDIDEYIRLGNLFHGLMCF